MPAPRQPFIAMMKSKLVSLPTPAVPYWGAILIGLVMTGCGCLLDAGIHSGDFTALSAFCYVLGCVAAVIVVEYSGLFSAVVQPPLLLFCIMPTVSWIFPHGPRNGLKGLLLNCSYPLIEHFPLMLFTSAVVLLIGMIRWYVVMVLHPSSRQQHSSSKENPSQQPRILAKMQRVLKTVIGLRPRSTGGSVSRTGMWKRTKNSSSNSSPKGRLSGSSASLSTRSGPRGQSRVSGTSSRSRVGGEPRMRSSRPHLDPERSRQRSMKARQEVSARKVRRSRNGTPPSRRYAPTTATDYRRYSSEGEKGQRSTNSSYPYPGDPRYLSGPETRRYGPPTQEYPSSPSSYERAFHSYSGEGSSYLGSETSGGYSPPYSSYSSPNTRGNYPRYSGEHYSPDQDPYSPPGLRYRMGSADSPENTSEPNR